MTNPSCNRQKQSSALLSVRDGGQPVTHSSDRNSALPQLLFSPCSVHRGRGASDVYGKGPDYFLLKTAIFPILVFLLLFSMKFHTELENDQHDIFQ